MDQNSDYNPGIADDCPCPKTTCSMWGKCRECVAANINCKLLPYCMQVLLKSAVSSLAGLIECDLVEQKKPDGLTTQFKGTIITNGCRLMKSQIIRTVVSTGE